MQLRLFAPSDDAIDALAERYISDLECRAAQGLITDGTVAMRSRYVRCFFRDVSTDEPTNADVISWLGAHPEWRSPHTISDAVASIVACLRWGVDERLVAACRINKRRLNLATPQPRATMFRAEADRFLRAIKTSCGYRKSRAALRFAVWFLSRTGCRTCEMRELRWEWIDLDRGLATLAEHKTDSTGKPRLIVLPRAVLRILRRHRRASGVVMLNGRGRPWTREGFARLFRRYLMRAGMATGVTPYSLRHGFAAALLDDGEATHEEIAELMGHASTKLIRYYGRSAKPQIDRLRGKIDRLGKRK